MHGYARRNSVEGLARDTACRAAGQIGLSNPPRSADVRKGSLTGHRRLLWARSFWGQERGVRADRGELENRVLPGLRDEALHRVVLVCLEVLPRGRGDLDVPLEHRPGLRPVHLPDGVVTFVAATSQPDLPGGASVMHPRHRPVRGDQPTPPVMLDSQDRISACPAGPAPPRGQEVGVRHETRTDERTHDRVLQTAPTARPVALPGAKPRRSRVGVACVSHAITLPPTGPATLHERYPAHGTLTDAQNPSTRTPTNRSS